MEISYHYSKKIRDLPIIFLSERLGSGCIDGDNVICSCVRYSELL